MHRPKKKLRRFVRQDWSQQHASNTTNSLTLTIGKRREHFPPTVERSESGAQCIIIMNRQRSWLRATASYRPYREPSPSQWSIRRFKTMSVRSQGQRSPPRKVPNISSWIRHITAQATLTSTNRTWIRHNQSLRKPTCAIWKTVAAT